MASLLVTIFMVVSFIDNVGAWHSFSSMKRMIYTSITVKNDPYIYHNFAEKFSNSHNRNKRIGAQFAMNMPKLDENESSKLAPTPDKDKNKWFLRIAVGAIALGALYFGGQSIDFNTPIERVLTKITDMGPYGYLYFSLIYILAEVLAIPVVALTASSGYLFGLVPGTLIVLSCATVAASISFFIGRTFLRNWAQKMIASSPKWRAIDKSIAKEGFKVVLLLRLSPLLPFAISNYIYGVTSVDFLSFIAATFFGFAPGSFGVVYFGSAGKALMAEGGLQTSSVPWYVYLAIGSVVVITGQAIAKFATDTIKQMEEEEATGSGVGDMDG